MAAVMESELNSAAASGKLPFDRFVVVGLQSLYLLVSGILISSPNALGLL
jgi:hypothetical protein